MKIKSKNAPQTKTFQEIVPGDVFVVPLNGCYYLKTGYDSGVMLSNGRTAKFTPLDLIVAVNGSFVEE